MTNPYLPGRPVTVPSAPSVYSPTETEMWQFCPQARWLGRRWRPAVLGPADVARALGAGVAEALAGWWRERPPVETVVARAREAARREVAATGAVPAEPTAASLGVLDARAERAVRLAIDANPVPPEWSLLGVELDLGAEYGHARPDLVFRADPGAVAVVDYKLRITAEARALDRARTEYARSWQLWHYCWALGQRLGEPVRHYAIVLLVLEPRARLEWWPYWLRPEQLERWEAYARACWADMAAEDAGERPVRGQTRCVSVWGPCPYLRACWTYMLDETLMTTEYVRLD